MKKCPSCGNMIKDAYLFCDACGARLQEAEQPAAAQPATEQPVYQQPATEQPVYQQPATEQPVYQQQPMYQQPVYKQPRQPSLLAAKWNDLLTKGLLLSGAVAMGIQAISILFDNIPIMSVPGKLNSYASMMGGGSVSIPGLGAFIAAIIVLFLLGLASAGCLVLSWLGSMKQKKTTSLMSLLGCGLAAGTNLIHFILILVVRGKVSALISQSASSIASELGLYYRSNDGASFVNSLKIPSYFFHFPMVSLLLFAAFTAMLALTMMYSNKKQY